MKILIIIPAYNEQESIVQVVRDLTSQTFPPQHVVDYIIINDCSSDRTKEICERNHLNILHLPINLGIGGGVQTGYRYALEHDYDIAVQMDGDGQHDPAYLSTIIEPIENDELDMVIGSRFIRKEGFQSSGLRRFGIKILKVLIRLCSGVTIYDATSGFRAVSRPLIQLFAADYAQDYPEPEAILTAALQGFRIGEKPVVMRERQGGQSSIRAFSSAYYMLKVSLSLLICRLRGRRNIHLEGSLSNLN